MQSVENIAIKEQCNTLSEYIGKFTPNLQKVKWRNAESWPCFRTATDS